MKKYFKLLLTSTVMMFVFLLSISFSALAEDTNELKELVTSGGAIKELKFDSLEFQQGLNRGYGSISQDSYAVAIADPNDPDNTVVKLSYSELNQGWSSFFKKFPFQSADKYRVSLDLKYSGDSDNIGLRITGPGYGWDHSLLANQTSWTDIDGRPGWKNYTVDFNPEEGKKVDILNIFMHTKRSNDIVLLIDNLSIYALDAENNPTGIDIITGGTFEGWLDYVIEEPNGDFENWHQVTLPDIVFDSGVANGWGSLHFDSRATAMKDPQDFNNEVLLLSYTDVNQDWSSFIKLIPTASLKKGMKYKFSIDFNLNGRVADFGMAFAGPGVPRDMHIIRNINGSSTINTRTEWVDIPGKTGWANYTFEGTLSAIDQFDSIQVWFKTAKLPDNYALLDNISLVELDSEGNQVGENLVNGGNFEGFLDYGVHNLTTTPVGRGPKSGYFVGEDVSVPTISNQYNSNVLRLGYTTNANSGVRKLVAIPTNGDYNFSFDVKLSEDFDAKNIELKLINKDNSSLNVTSLVLDNGVKKGTWLKIEGKDGWYNVTLPVTITNTDFDYFELNLDTESKSYNYLYLDNLSLTEKVEIPEEPEQPEEPVVPVIEKNNLIWVWFSASVVAAFAAGGVLVLFVKKK
ncbi:MAG: hypothetical protein K0Q49_1524 [Haloplasmataceae bacterium]|jgi:hypothetical protein|nr:hypothetical protein [Haloplasmataceae bacterium]